MTSGDVNRKSKRDRCRPSVLLEDLHLVRAGTRSRQLDARRCRTSRQGSQGGLHGSNHLVGRVTADRDRQVRSRVHSCSKGFDIIKRDRRETRRRSERYVTIGSAAKNIDLELLFAKLLFVVRSQVLSQRIQLRFFEPIEVLTAKSGLKQLRQHDAKKSRPFVAVNPRRECRHLLVGLPREGARNRV